MLEEVSKYLFSSEVDSKITSLSSNSISKNNLSLD